MKESLGDEVNMAHGEGKPRSNNPYGSQARRRGWEVMNKWLIESGKPGGGGDWWKDTRKTNQGHNNELTTSERPEKAFRLQQYRERKIERKEGRRGSGYSSKNRSTADEKGRDPEHQREVFGCG